jgi:hypothetical protein
LTGLDPLQLLLHLGARHGLAVHRRNYVNTRSVRTGLSGHKIQQHSNADHSYENAEYNARAELIPFH